MRRHNSLQGSGKYKENKVHCYKSLANLFLRFQLYWNHNTNKASKKNVPKGKNANGMITTTHAKHFPHNSINNINKWYTISQ